MIQTDQFGDYILFGNTKLPPSKFSPYEYEWRIGNIEVNIYTWGANDSKYPGMFDGTILVFHSEDKYDYETMFQVQTEPLDVVVSKMEDFLNKTLKSIGAFL